MSSGGKNVTTTQTQQLPGWLDSANQYGASQARSLYQRGGAQYYPGSTVAPLSSQQEQYLTNANNLGANGNPTLNAANSYSQDVMSGKYLNPSSNPYLQDTFNQAANAVQNRVGSQFAGMGRNLESSIPVQNDQMNQLATQIYGGNYQAERANQQQAAANASNLNGANLANLGAQAQAGALQQQQSQNYINAAQDRWNYNQNLPQQNLANYMGNINALQHGSTTTQQQPIYRNQAAGAMGGAMAGYQMGQGFGGYGGLIGAGLGALGGYFGS